MRLALATGNRDKVREISSILRDLPIEIVTHADFPGYNPPEEKGSTFLENAALKAISFAERSGLPCLADDSGLEVGFLDGEPGVRSARYAGPEADYAANNEKLLKALRGVPPSGRGAAFRCLIALYDPADLIKARGWRRTRVLSRLIRAFEGRVGGVIAEKPKGRGGFGYDPLFVWPPAGMTFAEMSPAAKNFVSHRARALRELTRFLEAAEIA